MANFRFQNPFGLENKPSPTPINYFKEEEPEQVFSNFEIEYPPSLIPKAEPLRPKLYTPQIATPEQYAKMKQIDDLFNLNPASPEEEKEERPGIAESYAIPAKFITKDETSENANSEKIEVLVEKLKEYKQKIIEVRANNLETLKKNIEFSREIERLNFKIEALEKRQEESDFMDTQKKPGGVIKLKDRNREDAYKKQRQEMQNELMMGINLVGGDDLNNLIGREVSKKGIIRRLIEGILNCFSKLVILNGDYKRIESQYDKSIAAYFGFHKFIVNLSIIVLVIYLYLLVFHIINFSGNTLAICSGSPCFAMYYGFHTDEADEYVICFTVMIIVTVISSITKYVRADKLKTRSEIYNGNEFKVKKFSAIVFNSWPWSINSEIDTTDQKSNIYNMVHTALSDDIRKREARNRTAAQKTKLLLKRVFGNIIFIVILISGWVIIVILSLTEETIGNQFNNSALALSLLMKFLPKFGVSFVNAILPALTVKITSLESWDTSSFIIKIQIFRIYAAKVLNVVLYALLNLELVSGSSWFFSSTGSINFQSSDYNCREDQAGLNLVLLVITEAITSKLIPLTFVLMYFTISKCKKEMSWKKEIKVAQQVINIIYFQGLIWICIPFFPFVTVLAPVFLFIDFKFQYFRLRKFQLKPIEQTQSYDVLILIMRLFNFTMLMILVYFGYFLTVNMTHGTYGTANTLCGPFLSGTAANLVLVTDIKNTVVISQIWNYVLNYSPVFWVLIIILLTQLIFRTNKLSLLEEFIEEKQYETDQQLLELQRKNDQLQKEKQYKDLLISRQPK